MADRQAARMWGARCYRLRYPDRGHDARHEPRSALAEWAAFELQAERLPPQACSARDTFSITDLVCAAG